MPQQRIHRHRVGNKRLVIHVDARPCNTVAGLAKLRAAVGECQRKEGELARLAVHRQFHAIRQQCLQHDFLLRRTLFEPFLAPAESAEIASLGLEIVFLRGEPGGRSDDAIVFDSVRSSNDLLQRGILGDEFVGSEHQHAVSATRFTGRNRHARILNNNAFRIAKLGAGRECRAGR